MTRAAPCAAPAQAGKCHAGPEKTMKFCLVKVYGQNQLQTVATTSKVYSCNVKQLSNDMYALLISVTLKAIKPNGYTAVW